MLALSEYQDLNEFIKIDSAPGKGRFAVARCVIRAGTCVLEAEPYAFAILNNNKKRVCRVCFSNTPKSYSIKCRECQQIYFCSNFCKSQVDYALNGKHGDICALMKKIDSMKISRDSKNVMMLMVEIFQSKMLEKKQTDSIRDMLEILNEVTKTSLGIDLEMKAYLERRPRYSQVECLESHASKWDKGSKDDWKKPIALISQWFPNVTTDEVAHFISRIESNGFGIFSARKDTLIGRALYPLGSYFNHSCLPNVNAERCGLQMRFITLRDVEEGEELNISYINAKLPRSKRRDNLLTDYYYYYYLFV